jgi:diguanylate cyclase (GGDEF)-like protein
MIALRTKGLNKPASKVAGKGLGLVAGARFEMVLLGLLLLTAGAIIGKDTLLERTLVYSPRTLAPENLKVFSDHDAGGGTTTRDLGPLKWACDLRGGNAYPYCGYEFFIDHNRGAHGADLTNMRSLAVTLMYQGLSTSFRVHLKNFDPRYSTLADDESPKYLRVEADTTPGKWQTATFVPSDFGVADWWLRKRKLAPEFGKPQFDNVTSFIIETGSEAPLGHHVFEVRNITIRKAILSDAQWYSLLLGTWIAMIVVYLGYRVANLRKALKERRTLEDLALRDAREAANRDPLTGLLNRRGLGERFDMLVHDRGKAVSTAVILIDIDHFKRLNDTQGHDYGDEVLAAFAKVINRNVRVVDVTARWGGEEFVVVCADVDRKGAQRIAEKLRACVEAFDFGRGGLVTASFGIHWVAAIDTDLTALVAQADKALYVAKADGRNCCRLHRPAFPRAA